MQRHTFLVASALIALLALSTGGLATPEGSTEMSGLTARVDELESEVDELQDQATNTTVDVAVLQALLSDLDEETGSQMQGLLDDVRAIEIDDDEQDTAIGSLDGRLTALEGAVAGGSPAPVSPTRHFLKIGNISGESKDDGHLGEIDVLAWTFGVSHPTAATSGGTAASKVVLSDISLTKRVDKSSPLLFLSCAQGKHIPEVVLTTRGNGTDYLVITLNDVLITSYQTGGGEDAADPSEHVSLRFGTFKFAYTEQDEKGSTSSTVDASWDVTEQESA